MIGREVEGRQKERQVCSAEFGEKAAKGEAGKCGARQAKGGRVCGMCRPTHVKLCHQNKKRAKVHGGGKGMKAGACKPLFSGRGRGTNLSQPVPTVLSPVVCNGGRREGEGNEGQRRVQGCMHG